MKRASFVQNATEKRDAAAPISGHSAARQSLHPADENLMRIQHTYGNQAVQQMVRSGGIDALGKGGFTVNRPSSPGIVMRKELLDDETQETKRNLTFDTDGNTRDLRNYFGLSGTPVLATNVTSEFSYNIDSIEAMEDKKTKEVLKKGLRLYALGIFDLMPDETTGVATSGRLNLVHVENLDLRRWGGPNTSFRFTCIGRTDKTTNAINVRILIESFSLPQNYMAYDSAAQGIEKTAEKYGIRRDMNYDPLATTQTSIPDNVWSKVLRSLGRIGEWMLMRLRDITFVVSPLEKGPNGEGAEYKTTVKDGARTRHIILYQKILSADEQEFAFTIQHEIGHALDYAPAESPSSVDKNKLGHNDPEFLEAMKKDGGQAAAVTTYGKKDAYEYYAESYAMFISEPGTLNVMRPNIYNYFNTYQWKALEDPNLNPYAPKPGEKRPVTGMSSVGIGLF